MKLKKNQIFQNKHNALVMILKARKKRGGIVKGDFWEIDISPEMTKKYFQHPEDRMVIHSKTIKLHWHYIGPL